MEAGPADRATLLVTAGSAGIAFMIGFNLGAFRVVFFEQLLTVWVVATVVLIGSVVSDLPPNTWPRRLILLIPSLWLVSAWIDNSTDLANGERVAFALTMIVTAVALPFVAWILVTAINTDFAALPGRNKGLVIGTVAIFVVVGFAIGARNDLLLNCDDFKVSGNDLPDNCLQVTSDR